MFFVRFGLHWGVQPCYNNIECCQSISRFEQDKWFVFRSGNFQFNSQWRTTFEDKLCFGLEPSKIDNIILTF
jgi:hypothetical protein